MKKVEVIKLVQEKVIGHGLELTQKDVSALFDTIDEVIVEIFNQGEKATIGNSIKVEVKECAARSGITHLEGVEDTEWSTPACKKINIKVVKSFADKHKVLI